VTENTTILLSQISLGTCNTTITNTATVTVNDIPQVTIDGGCVGPFYTLTASPIGNSFDPNAVTYSWEDTTGNPIVGNTQSIVVSEEGDYSVTVTSNGCSGTSAAFNADSITCVIQKGISVNSTPDGLNDCFDLEGFNVNKLSIFNRYGMKVYSRNDYTNQWCGQSDNGDELPDGTYYYVIERDNGETKTGWIYINKEN
jgi:gliding motility-associated-like protein